MNKFNLITDVAQRSYMTKRDVEAVLEAFVDVVIENVSRGDRIKLINFGVFETAVYHQRDIKNPANGEPVRIEEHYFPVFRPGRKFKDEVLKHR